MEIIEKIYYVVGVVSLFSLPILAMFLVVLSLVIDEKEWVLRIPKRKK